MYLYDSLQSICMWLQRRLFHKRKDRFSLTCIALGFVFQSFIQCRNPRDGFIDQEQCPVHGIALAGVVTCFLQPDDTALGSLGISS